jgi:hypothetical protein
VYSSYHGCTQYHSKGVYTIPYRSIFSQNISNLYFAGRLISVSHAAFGSTRVISTGTLCGQAAALAVRLCLKNKITPREILGEKWIGQLQRDLIQTGQYIPTVLSKQEDDLVHLGGIVSSSTFQFSGLSHDGTWLSLARDSAMLLPFATGKIPKLTFKFKADVPTSIKVSFCVSNRLGNFTPDSCLATKEESLAFGTSEIELDFDVSLTEPQYGFVLIHAKNKVFIAQSDVRVTGVLSLFNRGNQKKDEHFGIEEIPFFAPGRRPDGKNFAMKVNPGLKAFEAEQLRTFVYRPAGGKTNAWVSALSDEYPELQVKWDSPQLVKSVVLWFDTDFDHAMESCLMGHPENEMPFCVQSYKIIDDQGNTIHETTKNHHSRNEIRFEKGVQTSALTLRFDRKLENVPVSLFGLQVF